MKRRRCCLVEHVTGWWISGDGSNAPETTFRDDIAFSELGDDGDVLVEVVYSALNYKDALALTGNPGVIRDLPLIPGIDAVGTVRESTDQRFGPGDWVALTGYGYGERRHGGLATMLRAHADHLVMLPSGLTPREAAGYGTAGFTAALAVRALEEHGVTAAHQHKPIAVTGAAGAVGSFATYFLARHGFTVTAITGRTDEENYLRSLGASTVMSRQEVLSWPNRPLLAEQFDGVIDQAGGPLLAAMLASVAHDGVVVSCGLAGGSDVHTTVMPFILRGVTLTGINSVNQPHDVREKLWAELATLRTDLPWSDLIVDVPLAGAKREADRVLAGATRGRVVVQMPT